MEPECSSPYSQKPATWPYPEPHRSSPFTPLPPYLPSRGTKWPNERTAFASPFPCKHFDLRNPSGNVMWNFGGAGFFLLEWNVIRTIFFLDTRNCPKCLAKLQPSHLHSVGLRNGGGHWQFLLGYSVNYIEVETVLTSNFRYLLQIVAALNSNIFVG
jgi:hypothetical protein